MLKKLGAMLFSVAMVTGIGVVATATPASATHTCVDNFEWNRTEVGTLKYRLENFYDTNGSTASFGGGIWVKKYDACGNNYSKVRIRYTRSAGEWRVQNGWRY